MNSSTEEFIDKIKGRNGFSHRDPRGDMEIRYLEKMEEDQREVIFNRYQVSQEIQKAVRAIIDNVSGGPEKRAKVLASYAHSSQKPSSSRSSSGQVLTQVVLTGLAS